MCINPQNFDVFPLAFHSPTQVGNDNDDDDDVKDYYVCVYMGSVTSLCSMLCDSSFLSLSVSFTLVLSIAVCALFSLSHKVLLCCCCCYCCRIVCVIVIVTVFTTWMESAISTDRPTNRQQKGEKKIQPKLIRTALNFRICI